ncbi:AraC family transcriptional regulator [Labilibaculum manganireducens]|uniref:AraC family transcriptional regulator n=1 Tax=Labilibaculum manganireducens TaxID=1940525 RepID=A0A2N3I4K0_9BACT|nr:helix-turn-helix domain-containing protein [Labilibaculum manganireducens]PKQ65221.1 AraC family transcriptional regulator [Labilibaculum manganireducens]
MKNIFRIESVADYNKLNGLETFHPLVSIVDFSQTVINYSEHTHFYYGVYAIFLKEVNCGELKYGRNTYDYEEGSLVFVSPGQILELVRNNSKVRKGWALMFHPDLILGTNLGKQIRDYSFFSYDINEALHISERERKMILELFDKIQFEVSQPIDKHSRRLIVNNIQLFLDYCMRFYDRQFITREYLNKGILEKFENELNTYFKSVKPQELGLPSVAYFADAFHLSANYFGDLVKKETGKTAQEYIQLTVMNIAKDRILDISKPVSEIAYELGFKYPQHFTRMFKKSVGMSPSEYRNLN